ncbi:MAG: response regulator [Sphingobacteriaceae bacterium]|jgi:CheY-like chemotaxis protein|nr:response regulator [Sphingobacteriaceae bacterium]
MSRSIFIVDDYPINLKIGEMFIKKHGFFDKISTYLDAEEALNYLTIHMNNEALLPDVILLDLDMPLMDGWQFLDRFEDIMHFLAKNVEIFILSATIDYYERQRAKRYPSIKGILPKPLEIDSLHDIALRLGSVG